MRKLFWNMFYKTKAAVLRIKYPTAGRYERILRALGYSDAQIRELRKEYGHLAVNIDDVYRDELSYLD